MVIDISRFIDRFIEEARDHVRQLNDGLASIEAGDIDPEIVHGLFRSAHTIKGASRMLKLAPVTELAHVIEDVLDSMRDSRIHFNEGTASLLYRGVDALSEMLDQLAKSRGEVVLTPSVSAICLELQDHAMEGSTQTSDASSSASIISSESDQRAAPPSMPFDALSPSVKNPVISETVRIRLDKLDELIRQVGELFESGNALHALGQQAYRLAQTQHVADSSLVSQVSATARSLRDLTARHDTVLACLHDSALAMRMLPLAVIFEPLGRSIRDFARSIGKDVEFSVQGGEIELDRHIIDRLSDPLLHILRNAIDHGIEASEERLKQGKPARGRLRLHARQEGSHAVIEVHDDGQGVDYEAVRAKAISRGLLKTGEAGNLTERAITGLLFLPGFSTSAIITDVSGRGVGLDVVRKTLVEDLSGEIEVVSKAREGTCFTLRLPQTLSRMRLLLAKAAGNSFALGSAHVEEVVRRSVDDLIHTVQRDAVILRNEFIPVVRSVDLLGLPILQSSSEKQLLLAILKLGSEKLALCIDEIADERVMVINPLPSQLVDAKLVSGVVRSGIGELLPVLNVPMLFSHSSTLRASDRARESTHDSPSSDYHILVVDDSLNTRELEKELLEAHGYHVSLAEDGEDALAKALDVDFDAVLTDIEMPRMDGFTLTIRLRETDTYRHRPIIIITSREREEDKRRGMQVGADAYIAKGDFDQTNLVSTLNALLGRSFQNGDQK